jgi:hypothetical protein
VQSAKDVGIPDADILKWDLEETKRGKHIMVFMLHTDEALTNWLR